jgi:hypothetical protein
MSSDFKKTGSKFENARLKKKIMIIIGVLFFIYFLGEALGKFYHYYKH